MLVLLLHPYDLSVYLTYLNTYASYSDYVIIIITKVSIKSWLWAHDTYNLSLFGDDDN